jgi:hypothetical protein
MAGAYWTAFGQGIRLP